MGSLHTLLPRIWQHRGLQARLLLPLSWLYGVLVRLRKTAYRLGWMASGHPGAFVIVVGNVVAGGAGKTPTTIALVQHLTARGFRVGVVSRGHGRTTRDTRAVQVDDTARQAGDEPLLIHRHTRVPVWVGASRLQAARCLLQAHPEVQIIVCDDGLQHLALQRDLEICLMDDRGTGNGWLLPAGPLREPWPRPVDLLLYTHGRADGHGFLAHRQLADQAVNAHGQTCDLQALSHQAVDAVAGLARPQAFFDMLRAHGLHLADAHALPDHHDFSDWQPTSSGRALLCTEKDAVKLWAHQPEAWAVPLQMVPEPLFWQAVDERLDRHAMPGTAPVSSPHGQQTA
ncbi:MAG: tetraacyldisaccharide 4'-kinase [Limnohabitans sp.]